MNLKTKVLNPKSTNVSVSLTSQDEIGESLRNKKSCSQVVIFFTSNEVLKKKIIFQQTQILFNFFLQYSFKLTKEI